MLIRKLCSVALVCLLCSCGGGGSSSGGQQAPTTPDPTAPSQKVITIGDSIGNGFGIAAPWPDRLAGLIAREVENTSVSDEQTSFGLANIESLIAANNPTHVFILLGTNDAIRGSVNGAVENLQAMVDIAQRNNVIAVVGTLPPITRDAGENQRAEQISQGIRSLNGARIAPVRGMLGDGSQTIADGVHPNNEGQQLIAEAFATQF